MKTTRTELDFCGKLWLIDPSSKRGEHSYVQYLTMYQRAVAELTTAFGGSTAQKAHGMWYSITKGMMTDAVIVLEVFGDNDVTAVAKLHEVATNYLLSTPEQAVLYSINGVGHLLEKNHER